MMKAIRKKEIEKVLNILERAKNSSTFENSIFSDEIKNETHLYRKTWITDIITQAIGILENEIQRRT